MDMTRQIQALAVGQSIKFPAHGHTFQVKRLRCAVYHLWRWDIASRSRFGDLSQIVADASAAVETGALVGGDKGRF